MIFYLFWMEYSIWYSGFEISKSWLAYMEVWKWESVRNHQLWILLCLIVCYGIDQSFMNLLRLEKYRKISKGDLCVVLSSNIWLFKSQSLLALYLYITEACILIFNLLHGCFFPFGMKTWHALLTVSILFRFSMAL